MSSKISGYSAITSVQADDLLPVVDVHDTTMAPTGTTKKMTLSQLPFDAAGAATGVANAIAAELGAANGIATLDSGGHVPAGQLPTVPIADGGTGQTTAAAAYNALSPMTTKGDMEYDSAAGAAARLAVGSAGQVLGVSGGVPAWGMGMTLLAATAVAGYTLVNGTGTILTWTAPSDGALHRFTVLGSKHVTSIETGGLIRLAFTLPDGFAVTFSIFPGSQAAGWQAVFNAAGGMDLIQPGSTVTINQNSALTAGASTLWAEIWGS